MWVVVSFGAMDQMRRQEKRVLLTFTLMLAFFATGFGSYLVRTDFMQGKTYNQLIPAEDGSLIGVKITVPNSATSDEPVPLVLLIHGLSGSKEMMQSLATELLRQGIGSIAIDLPGHGETTSTLSLGGFNKTSTDIQGVLNHANDLRLFDFSRMAIIGHSLGASVSMYEATRHPDRYQSVVIIGNAGTFSEGLDSPFDLANKTNPKNVLVVIGQQDQLIDIEIARKALGRLVSDSKMNVDERYGDFESGTARKLVTPIADHLLEPYEPSAVHEILSWILTSFNMKFHQKFPLYFLNELFSLIQIVTFIVLILAMWMTVNEITRILGILITKRKPSSGGSLGKSFSSVLFIAFSIGFPTFYFVGGLIGTILLFLPGTSLISMILPSLATGMLIWFLGIGLMILTLFRWYGKETFVMALRDFVDSMTDMTRLKFKVLLAFIMFLFVALLVLIQQWLFHQDLRIYMPFLRISADWRRWLAFVTLAVILTPIFGLEHQFHQFWIITAPNAISSKHSKKAFFVAFVKIFGARSGILLALGLLQYLVKDIFGPLSFVTMLSIPIVFLLALLTIFNVIALISNRSSDEVGIVLGLIVGLIIGMNLPYIAAS